ncbi:AAA family ATPase [Methanospirillum lacunae]|nr:AAA family ATPase [Methanospirillum lacunae]
MIIIMGMNDSFNDEKIQLSHISIKDLFGIFNHEIPINTRDHITIIIGPNGVGKTIILKILIWIFKFNFASLMEIPFTSLKLDFNPNYSLTIKKERIKINSEKEVHTILNFYLNSPDSNSPRHWQYNPSSLLESNRYIKVFNGWEFSDEDIDDNIEWIGLNNKNSGRHRVVHTRRKKESQIEPWLISFLQKIDIHLIETQRLLIIDRGSDNEYNQYKNVTSKRNLKYVVEANSQDLVEKIKEISLENNAISQSLERTFPIRLAKYHNEGNISVSDIQRELVNLEQKRNELAKVGLVKKEEINLEELSEINPENISILSVYISDVKEKLKILDKFYEKVHLFTDIISSRFLFKSISIDQKLGFSFKSKNGASIPLSALSSGEQHELVLIYNLLFKVNNNALVLIDEPELSLHVCWQEQFINDIQKIADIIGFDIIIATHSPEIVSNKLNLTVQLNGD